MKVLVVPEDPTYDQHLLKPLLTQLCKSFGKPANVIICTDPVLGGKGEALKENRIHEIVERYQAMIDVIILCVDRDGDTAVRHRLESIERNREGDGVAFLGQEAWEEIETWALAGLKLPSQWRWRTIRSEVQVKEIWFDKLVELRGLADAPGRGRKPLGKEAAAKIGAIRQKCPEDFDRLATRLKSLGA